MKNNTSICDYIVLNNVQRHELSIHSISRSSRCIKMFNRSLTTLQRKHDSSTDRTTDPGTFALISFHKEIRHGLSGIENFNHVNRLILMKLLEELSVVYRN